MFLVGRALWSGVWRCWDGVCTERGSCAVAGLISGGEQSIRRFARQRLYASSSSSRGRQASTAKMSMGVHMKQLVVHLWTLCEKTESFRVMWAVRVKVFAP